MQSGGNFEGPAFPGLPALDGPQEAPAIALAPAAGQPALQQQQGAPFSELSLEQIRCAQHAFAEARDWQQYHTPRNLLMALVGEVGELSEVFQWKGEVQRGLPEFTPEERTHVAEELSDVLLYLVRLADVCGVDLAAAVQHKVAKNAEKYPADACRGSAAKYTAYAAAGQGQAHAQAQAQQLPLPPPPPAPALLQQQQQQQQPSGSGGAAPAPRPVQVSSAAPPINEKRRRFSEQQQELLLQLAEKAGWSVTNLTLGGWCGARGVDLLPLPPPAATAAALLPQPPRWPPVPAWVWPGQAGQPGAGAPLQRDSRGRWPQPPAAALLPGAAAVCWQRSATPAGQPSAHTAQLAVRHFTAAHPAHPTTPAEEKDLVFNKHRISRERLQNFFNNRCAPACPACLCLASGGSAAAPQPGATAAGPGSRPQLLAAGRLRSMWRACSLCPSLRPALLPPLQEAQRPEEAQDLAAAAGPGAGDQQRWLRAAAGPGPAGRGRQRGAACRAAAPAGQCGHA
jgi:dCTP diphosphatase